MRDPLSLEKSQVNVKVNTRTGQMPLAINGSSKVLTQFRRTMRYAGLSWLVPRSCLVVLEEDKCSSSPSSEALVKGREAAESRFWKRNLDSRKVDSSNVNTLTGSSGTHQI